MSVVNILFQRNWKGTGNSYLAQPNGVAAFAQQHQIGNAQVVAVDQNRFARFVDGCNPQVLVFAVQSIGIDPRLVQFVGDDLSMRRQNEKATRSRLKSVSISSSTEPSTRIDNHLALQQDVDEVVVVEHVDHVVLDVEQGAAARLAHLGRLTQGRRRRFPTRVAPDGLGGQPRDGHFTCTPSAPSSSHIAVHLLSFPCSLSFWAQSP